jgi:hypothetical protein
LEVAGAANLAERFPDGFPAEPDQLAFLADVCTRTADTYLAPTTLSGAGMAVHYDTVSPASWAAGSRQMSCSIGTPADGGWASKVGSTRVQPLVDGPAPAPPPPSPPAEPPREEPAPAESRSQTPVTNAPPPPSSAPSTAAPSTNAAPPPVYTTPPEALPTTVTAAAPPPGSPPPPGAPPPGAPPPTSTETTGPPPGVVEIPGMAPITLPWLVPPPPPPPEPAPAPLGPAPGPPA